MHLHHPDAMQNSSFDWGPDKRESGQARRLGSSEGHPNMGGLVRGFGYESGMGEVVFGSKTLLDRKGYQLLLS